MGKKEVDDIKKGINWGHIIATAVITGLITLVVGVIGGIILFNIQTRQPELIYTVADTQPFPGKDRNFAIYNTSISNPGKVQISNIVAAIQIPSAQLDDVRFNTDLTLKYTYDIVGDILNLQIPEFNPNDTISISVLATGTSSLPTKPIVSARGSGIVGTERTQPKTNFASSIFSVSLASVLAALMVGVMSVITLIRRRKAIEEEEEEIVLDDKHIGDQNEILAYLCGLHNLKDEVHDYLSRPRITSYWAEADRFAAIAITNPTSQEAQNIEKVLKDLLDYASIAKNSKGIICYDIARIELARGNRDEAKKYLKDAVEYAGKLINIRLKIDTSLQALSNEVAADRPG